MRSLAIILCILMFAATSFAEEAAELGEITVTATRAPRKVEEVSSSVSIINSAAIETTRGWNVGESLRTLAGVQAESTNGAYDTHIIIRGAGAKAAYGVREIMVMVDGIPITDPDSLTRLDMVDTATIERMEVVRGPNSTMYGANAAGGIINIITKNPLDSQGIRLRGAFGSDNSRDYHAQYGGSASDLYYLISATHRATDSWREWNKFKSTQVNGRATYVINNNSELEFAASHSNVDLQLPGSLTEEEFKDDPTQQASDWTQSGRYSKVSRASLSYRADLTAALELVASGYFETWEHFHPVPTGINDGGADVWGADIQGNIKHEIMGMKSLASIGFSTSTDDSKGDKYAYASLNTGTVNGKEVALKPYASTDEEGDLLKTSDSSVTKWGVFAQDSLNLTDSTIMDIGVRYDHVSFDINSEEFLKWSYITTKDGESYYNYVDSDEVIDMEKNWDRVSPRIGINHKLIDGLHLYAAISTGFQTPAESEFTTNEDLTPQNSVNYETGLKYRHPGGHTLDISVYSTNINDEIIKLMDDTGLSYYDNAGKTVHRGVELSGSARVTDSVTVGGAYAYSDFRFKDYVEMSKSGYPATITTYDRSDNNIPLVPWNQLSTFVHYAHPLGFYGRATSTTWGSYYVDTANSVSYSGFTTVDLKAGYAKQNIDLFVMVGNVLDRQYATEVTESYGNIRYTPGAPRTFTAGVSYEF